VRHELVKEEEMLVREEEEMLVKEEEEMLAAALRTRDALKRGVDARSRAPYTLKRRGTPSRQTRCLASRQTTRQLPR
jgi:hypothetical protein